MARWIDLIQDEIICEFIEVDEDTKNYLLELEENIFSITPEEYKAEPATQMTFQSKEEYSVC